MPTRRRRKSPKGVARKVAAAERRIVDLSEDFKYLRMLVYGKNGTGKTFIGATAPKPIIIDCNEQGTLSVRKVKGKVFHAETWTDIDLIYWYLKRGKHDRRSVIIDTVSFLQNLCIKFVLGDEASRDPTLDPTMPSKQVWGKVGELMRTVVMNFRGLPMHVIFLAQERRGFSEDDEEAPEIFPELSPSSRSTLTAAVNLIGRSYVKEVVVKKKEEGKKTRKVVQGDYRLIVAPSDRFVTKVNIQDHGLPGVIRNPNVSRIIKRIRDSGGVIPTEED